MGRTKKQLEDGELAQCKRFIAWRLKQFGEQFMIISRPNPPDFVLEFSGKQTWLEVTDVFFDDEDVDWQLSKISAPRGILENTDDKFINRAVEGLSKKLGKKSYLPFFNSLGKGFLLLTGRYWLIDDVLLYSLQQALRQSLSCADMGCFKEAYLECYVAGLWQYGMIYPQQDLIEETTN